MHKDEGQGLGHSITLSRCLLTHFVNVFFCTASLWSESRNIIIALHNTRRLFKQESEKRTQTQLNDIQDSSHCLFMKVRSNWKATRKTSLVHLGCRPGVTIYFVLFHQFNDSWLTFSVWLIWKLSFRSYSYSYTNSSGYETVKVQMTSYSCQVSKDKFSTIIWYQRYDC